MLPFPRTEVINSLLGSCSTKMHWLPVNFRTDFRILWQTCKALYVQAPTLQAEVICNILTIISKNDLLECVFPCCSHYFVFGLFFLINLVITLCSLLFYSFIVSLCVYYRIFLLVYFIICPVFFGFFYCEELF